ncbi:MAG: hypothetical protein ACRDRR_21085 [Pseudonocardiaceae bacterium]
MRITTIQQLLKLLDELFGDGTDWTSSTAADVTFPLSGEQAQNAATSAAIGMRLGMPDHAVTVALATALQESGLAISAPSADLASTALAELGTAVLSGAHPIARGWSISSWLVAHASGLAVARVTFDGRTWTIYSGTWSQTGPADGVLSIHQARSAA